MNFKEMFLMVVVCCQMSFPLFAAGADLHLVLYKDTLRVLVCRYEDTRFKQLLLPVSAVPQDYQNKLLAYYGQKEKLNKPGSSQAHAEISTRLDEIKKTIANNLIPILKTYSEQQKNIKNKNFAMGVYLLGALVIAVLPAGLSSEELTHFFSSPMYLSFYLFGLIVYLRWFTQALFYGNCPKVFINTAVDDFLKDTSFDEQVEGMDLTIGDCRVIEFNR